MVFYDKIATNDFTDEGDFLNQPYYYPPNYAPQPHPGYPAPRQNSYAPPQRMVQPPLDPREQLRRTERSKLWRSSMGLGFFVLAYFVTMNLIAIVLMVYFMLTENSYDLNPTAEYLLDIAASVGAVLLPGLIYLAITRRKFNTCFGKSHVSPTLLIPLALMGMGAAMVANYAANLFDANIGVFGLQNQVSMEADSALNPLQVILYVIAVSIVPAFAEEFGFRGILMGSLRRYGDAFAIVASAVMFGAMHGNTTQIIFAFILGLVFGYIDCITDSIIPSILVHFLNNFYAVLMDVFETNTNVDQQVLYLVYLGVVLLFCIGGVLSFIYLAKRDGKLFRLNAEDNNGYPYANVLTLKEKLKAFFVNPGVMIALSVFLTETVSNLIPKG